MFLFVRFLLLFELPRDIYFLVFGNGEKHDKITLNVYFVWSLDEFGGERGVDGGGLWWKKR